MINAWTKYSEHMLYVNGKTDLITWHCKYSCLQQLSSQTNITNNTSLDKFILFLACLTNWLTFCYIFSNHGDEISVREFPPNFCRWSMMTEINNLKMSLFW